jgi:branched-chain amino acid transport system substrate-binding protein
VTAIPGVDQTFGGTFSNSTPAPGRDSPGCEKKDLPWLGKATPVKVVGG